MSDTKIRRTFEFTAEHQAALDKIKAQISVKTDTAAINYAIRLAARLSTCSESEIEQALWLRGTIERRMQDGGTLVIEKDQPPYRAELLIPPLAAHPTELVSAPSSSHEVPTRPDENQGAAAGYKMPQAA